MILACSMKNYNNSLVNPYLLICALTLSSVAMGEPQGPIAKTQVNKQTDLFETAFDDWGSVREKFEEDAKQSENMISSNEGFKLIANGSEEEILEGVQHLSDTPSYELKGKGQEELAKDPFNADIFVDYSKPLNKQYLKDARKIAKAQRKLHSSLIHKLKKIDIDCKTEQGPSRIEPEYHLQIEKEKVKNTKYNQTFCEEPRREYVCTNTLTVRCSNPSYVAGTLKNVEGNMTHTLTKEGVLIIGVDQAHYFYDAWGSQNDYIFTFNVSNAQGIESFKLLDVAWSDHVLIELNGKKIFGSSGVKSKLEMSKRPEDYRIGGDGERYYGADRGDGNYVPANTKQYFNGNPNYEARGYLKDGKNTLHIRLVYGKGGKIWTKLSYLEKTCNSWQEAWSERCNIK